MFAKSQLQPACCTRAPDIWVITWKSRWNFETSLRWVLILLMQHCRPTVTCIWFRVKPAGCVQHCPHCATLVLRWNLNSKRNAGSRMGYCAGESVGKRVGCWLTKCSVSKFKMQNTQERNNAVVKWFPQHMNHMAIGQGNNKPFANIFKLSCYDATSQHMFSMLVC